MARINTYERDTSVSGLDLLVGSEYYLDSGVPKYRTKNYSVNDLSTFFGLNSDSINSRLSSYLGVLNEDGSFTYSTAFANQTLSTVASVGYAAATDLTALSATVVTNKSSADASFTSVNQSIATETSARSSAVTTLTATVTNNKTTTDASAVTLTQAVADETSARASAVTSLNSSISNKPNIFRQTSVPTALSAKDVWFDTDDGNRMYVSTSVGDDQVTSGEWEETTDTRLANVVTSAATATTNISTLTTADTAKAAQITELNAQFTFSGGNITGVADALNTSINTAVSNGTSAISTSVDELKTQFTFSGNNITGVSDALNTSINTAASDAVSATATSLDKLEALFTFDGNNNVNGLAGSTTISSAIATAETNAVSTANTARANAQTALVATISKVFRQNDPPAVTEPVNSIWYDTNDSNKSYVLVAGSPRVWTYTVDATLATSASVQQVSDTAADINGNLSASHSLMVNAGGAIAGMKVSASTNDSGVSNSNVVFQADQFTIKTSSGTAQPFSVSGNVVTINGSLKIGNTDASAIETKANGANQDATSTIRSGTTKTDVGLGNVDDTSDAAVLGTAATASNTQDKTGGSVGGWTLESGYIYSGTKQTSDNFSSSGITLYSGGSLRAVNFLIDTGGNAFFKGDISGASGSFSGVLSGNSGSIGGWQIANTNLSSADGLLSIDSSSNSIIIKNSSGDTKVEITGSSSVTDPATVGSLSLQSGNSVSTAIVSGPISTSGSSASKAASKGSGYVYDNNETAAFQNKTLTVKATLSNIAYNISGNSVGTGSVVGNFGIAVYTSSSSNTPIAISDFVTVTTTGSTTGNVSMPTTIKSVSITVPSSATALYVRPYFGGGTAVTGNYGNQTTVTFRYPALSSVEISSSVNKVEISSGGMLVAASADQFFSLDKESNSESSPFIRSKGFMEHQGRLTVLNSSGTSGTGDIYLGGSNSNNSGYMRLFSNANSHKYIEWGDATSNSAFQLKLRYNGSQKFQFGSTGVFDAVSTKNFKINHLLESKEETHYLRHAAIEGPQADLIYRGKVTLSNGAATVNLDEAARMSEGTFVLLCRDIQCFTSNETSWDAVKASVLNNMLTINCQNTNSSDEISWMVIAERKDPSYINSDVTDDNGLYKTESEKED